MGIYCERNYITWMKLKSDEKWYENILRVEYWNIASASSIKLIINDYSPIRRREMEETTKEILYGDEEQFWGTLN